MSETKTAPVAARVEPSREELLARIAELERKQTTGGTGPSVTFRVGEKRGVSVYNLARFPVTLYYGQWMRLFAAMPELKAFLEREKAAGNLALKEGQ